MSNSIPILLKARKGFTYRKYNVKKCSFYYIQSNKLKKKIKKFPNKRIRIGLNTFQNGKFLRLYVYSKQIFPYNFGTYRRILTKFLQYYYVFTLLKTFKYEFVDCNQSENKYVFQIQLNSLYCPHYFMRHCSNLYHLYNNNYSFFILICSQPFCKLHLYIIPFTLISFILLTTYL